MSSSLKNKPVYTALLHDMVSTGVKVNGKFQVLPRGKEGQQMYVPRTSLFSTTFPDDIFSKAGQKLWTDLPAIDFIDHPFLRVKFMVAGAPVVLVPATRLFEQVALIDPSNPSQPVSVEYDDTAHQKLHAIVTAGTEDAVLRTMLIESEKIGRYGCVRELPVGSHYYYIPLANVFSNFGGLYMGEMRNRLQLRVTIPSTIIASGAGTITAEIQFGVEGRLLNDFDRALQRNWYEKFSNECRFLQPHRTRKQLTLSTSSAENYIDLPDVRGPIAYQLVLIRAPGQTNANNGRSMVYNIGDNSDARMELVDAQGNSITGSLPTKFLRRHLAADHFDNDFIASKPFYLIPYCKSMSGAIKGSWVGGRFFYPNSGDRIRLTLPQTATSEVQTITASTTPTSGSFYRFSFRGEQSAQLAIAANAAAIKTAIEAMREVAAHHLTVVASAALGAGTSITLTFSDPEGTLDGSLFEVVADGAGASFSTARTTAAVQGLPSSGSTWEVDVYSYMYRECVFTGTQLYSREAAVPLPTSVQ